MSDQTIQYWNIDSDPWQVVNNSSVNPVPADAFQPFTQNGALVITMTYSKINAGALAAWPFPVTTMPYMALDFQAYIDDVSLACAKCLEFDVKACVKSATTTAIPNVCDFSAQLNLAEGGMWQIDNASQQWTDTGFKPGPPAPNVWVPYSFRYFYDAPNGKFSVLSIAQNGVTFQIPSTMQELPVLTTTWTGSAIQRQLVSNTASGAVTMRYKGTVLRLSTQPLA